MRLNTEREGEGRNMQSSAFRRYELPNPASSRVGRSEVFRVPGSEFLCRACAQGKPLGPAVASSLLRTTAPQQILRERVWKPGHRGMRFAGGDHGILYDFQLEVAELESSPRCVLLLTELTPLIAWLCYPKSSKPRQP